MNKLTRSDLMTLEEYSEKRTVLRAQIIRYKKRRQVQVGENARLYFENLRTVQYQIQEVLRVEKTFDSAGIDEELNTYNPLIPDGTNLKATFMLEFPEAEERIRKTKELRGVEHKVWLQARGCEKVYPIANEDLVRNDDISTHAVHFFRYEFAPTMIMALKTGVALNVGVDHPSYNIDGLQIEQSIRDSLTEDFDEMIIN